VKKTAEYFVDTSIWIPFFRGADSRLGDFLDQLIDENRISINGIVMTELLTGARNSAEFDRLSSALSGLKFIEMDLPSSEAAGRNGSALKKKGISVPLSDLIIATDCIVHDFILIERDNHFAAISGHLALRRHSLPAG